MILRILILLRIMNYYKYPKADRLPLDAPQPLAYHKPTLSDDQEPFSKRLAARVRLVKRTSAKAKRVACEQTF